MPDDSLEISVGSKTLEKFLSVVSAGLGAVARPWHVRRNASAEADALESKARAAVKAKEILETSNQSAPQSQIISKFTDIDISDFQGRAAARIHYYEEKRQENIESVCKKAIPNLSNEIPDSKFDEDWISRFFGIVQDISDSELQEIWAKILAEEVLRTGSASLRTLDILKNISKEEANIFNKYAKLSIQGIIPDEDKMFEENKIQFGEILILSHAGLVSETSVTREIQSQSSLIFDAAIGHPGKAIVIRGDNPQDLFKISGYPLTPAGQELTKILRIVPEDELIISFAKCISNRPDPEVRLHIGPRKINNQKIFLGKGHKLPDDTWEIINLESIA